MVSQATKKAVRFNGVPLLLVPVIPAKPGSRFCLLTQVANLSTKWNDSRNITRLRDFTTGLIAQIKMLRAGCLGSCLTTRLNVEMLSQWALLPRINDAGLRAFVMEVRG